MNALEISSLRKVYRDDLVALDGIDLTVSQGDFFALLGPNGAGKSTAIGIISSLVNKTSGQVIVNGHDIDRERELAKKCIGLVPQEFNFNVFEPVREILNNVAGYNGIERRVARQRSEHYLKKLELWDKRRSIARDLSGGMKRRLMIARALVHEPALLILDEPTAGVDIEIRRSMWEFLSAINSEQGVTIILTTHYLEEAEALCRNVAIIDDGKIIEHGNTARLLSGSMFETFVLDLVEPLTEAPVLSEFRVVDVRDQQLEVEVPRGHSLNALFAELAQQGIAIGSMRNKSNRLEEFFLRLVNQNTPSGTGQTDHV
ncbi:MAG: ABC transporter ATP-binding protein [Gammaproteobacteria bacterium]|nr:ABC transporter ATP-binding protein [Gammaproteobacteria bacterium]